MALLDVLVDGRYQVTSLDAPFELILRVDLTRPASAQITQISGDKVYRNGGQLTVHDSFRSTGLSPEGVIQDWLSADIVYYGTKTGGTLKFTLDANNDVTLSYTETIALGSGPTFTFPVGPPVDRLLRKFVYAADVEKGMRFPPGEVNFSDARSAVTIEESFAVVGIDLQRSPLTFPIIPNGTVWRLGELQAALDNRINQSGKDYPFDIYLIVGNQYEDRNVTGVMFDKQNRRGTAVFYGTLASLYPSPRLDPNYVRTAVHEIGHTLNLPHAFESGSPADLGPREPTFMNYPQNYTGRGSDTPAQRSSDYWSDFAYTFAHHEAGFICHGATIDLITGGTPYVGETFDLAAMSTTRRRIWAHGAAMGIEGVRLELRLRPKRPNNLFEFGEPVHVEAELHNASQDSRPVHERIDPATGLTRFLIRKPNGAAVVYVPPYDLCMGKNECKLGPKESTHHDICLSYTADGFTFIEPGRYEFQAVHRTPEGQVYSNVLSVWIRYPTRAEENRIVGTFDDEVCRYFAAHGRPDLSRGVGILEDFASRPEFRDDHGNLCTDAHPLAHHFYRFKALMSLHGFRELRKTRRALALKWLVKPQPDFSLFQQALGLDAEFYMGRAVQEGRHPFSNIVYGHLSGVLAKTLGAQGNRQLNAKKNYVMKQVTDHLRGQKMKPKALASYRRKWR